MAIVAHPDDSEYGTAAAVAGWTDPAHDVGYLLVTRGAAGIDGLGRVAQVVALTCGIVRACHVMRLSPMLSGR